MAMCNECARDNSRVLPSAPKRHAHCRVQDDDIPMLHVEPTCTRLRHLRVVLQELEQDEPIVLSCGTRDDSTCDPPHKKEKRNL